MKKRFHRWAALSVASAVLFLACGGQAELSEDDIAFQKKAKNNELFSKLARKPGPGQYQNGIVGGVYVTTINDDPKTWNTLTARDGDSRDVIDNLFDALLDYDAYKKEWKPNLASFEVKSDEKADTMDVFFTLRDDLYWTTLAEPDKKVKVTSDDVVFWYDEIDGDETLQQPGYPQQFLEMPDGSKKRITIEKLDDRRFVFHYPRIIAMPELSSNMDFGPKYIFEPVKKKSGQDGLFKLWTVDTDPRTIPSIGGYYIASYKPGVNVTLQRNPHYWKKDPAGVPLPYIQTIEFKITPNKDTEKLMFQSGGKDSYTLRPEDLQEISSKDPKDYTVYYGGSSLGSGFMTWNQNPANLPAKYIKWFSNTKFRQAMSCFFNRDRVISQVYRGMAEPAIYFFAKANPYFDPKIRQDFLYNPERGIKLLAEIGISPTKDGLMADAEGNLIEYDLMMGSENNLSIDTANIFADECKKVGIKINVKPQDFQKLVDSIMKTFDWQAVMVSLGSNYWPSSGSNVWKSNGNFHVWRPMQKTPATDWEARVDKLYDQGYVTRDPVKAKAIYDEYQKILLDQVPLMYMVYPDSFSAYRDKWANVYVDTLQSPRSEFIYLKP